MGRSARHLRIRTIAAGLALAPIVIATARADVIEIYDDGTTTTYTGPLVSTGEGIRNLDTAAVSSTPAGFSEAPGPVSDSIAVASKRYRISNRLIEAVAWQESRFDQRAVSAKGARGVMQLMPATARELGVDADDLTQNIAGGTAYLSLLLHRFDGDLVRALSAYNAGPEATARYGGAPPFAETQGFVDAVLNRLAAMSADSGPTPDVLP